jgi:AcrR family transcriptional regulator
MKAHTAVVTCKGQITISAEIRRTSPLLDLTSCQTSYSIPNSIRNLNKLRNMVSDRRDRRFRRNKQAILDAALEIIREAGPAALSMRALGERSDYSAAGLYEYFGGKDEIIAAVCEQGHERLTIHMRRADPGLPVADYLIEIGMAYIRFALENPDYFLLMFTVAPPGPAGAASPEEPLVGDSSFNILLRAIRRGINEGVFRARPGFDLMEMAYAAWATVHGLAMLRVTNLRGYPMDFEAADHEALLSFVRGLRSEG